jgi:hypothetical protein
MEKNAYSSRNEKNQKYLYQIFSSITQTMRESVPSIETFEEGSKQMPKLLFTRVTGILQ